MSHIELLGNQVPAAAKNTKYVGDKAFSELAAVDSGSDGRNPVSSILKH